MAEESKPAVDWLINAFGLDLSLVSRLGGHSEPRTHRGKERFPGMTITYALMEKFELACKETPERARLIVKAKVTEILQENNVVTGIKYETRDGHKGEEHGFVIIATGGFGSDYSPNSYLQKYRPDLAHLPTTSTLFNAFV